MVKTPNFELLGVQQIQEGRSNDQSEARFLVFCLLMMPGWLRFFVDHMCAGLVGNVMELAPDHVHVREMILVLQSSLFVPCED